MSASLVAKMESPLPQTSCCVMDIDRESRNQPPAEESHHDLDTKKAIRELLDVLPKDILDELNAGTVDLKDDAFLDGLVDHISRLSLASPRAGQKILPKIIKLKKLINRSLRDSDPEVRVSATVTRTTARVGRNEPCPCGSGKKYKQCCLRKT
jgi:hypothetical protein